MSLYYLLLPLVQALDTGAQNALTDVDRQGSVDMGVPHVTAAGDGGHKVPFQLLHLLVGAAVCHQQVEVLVIPHMLLHQLNKRALDFDFQ